MKLMGKFKNWITFKSEVTLKKMKRELSLDKIEGKDTSELEVDIKEYERTLKRQKHSYTSDTGPG